MYYVGIDVGGTNLKAGLVDESYRLVATKKMPLQFVSMEQMGRRWWIWRWGCWRKTI